MDKKEKSLIPGMIVLAIYTSVFVAAGGWIAIAWCFAGLPLIAVLLLLEVYAPDSSANKVLNGIIGTVGAIPFYLPARIPRGFAPGMNGGESNFSYRGASAEREEYLVGYAPR